jgi:hypothetical protein
MKAVRAGRPFDPATFESRVKDFPSQIVGIVRPAIFIGPAKHKIFGPDVFGNLKVIHQQLFKTDRHMPDVFLTSLGGIQ